MYMPCTYIHIYLTQVHLRVNSPITQGLFPPVPPHPLPRKRQNSGIFQKQVHDWGHSLVRRDCCSVLQCVVVCCSVLQCVAVCCSVLQCVALHDGGHSFIRHDCCSVLHFTMGGTASSVVTVAVCCSVWQCVAVCGSALQCVAVCCS